MSTVSDVFHGSYRPPVLWLPTQSRVTTLADMLTFAAKDWNEIVRILDSFETVQPKALNLIVSGPKDAVLEAVGRVYQLCESLGLRAGAAQAQRIMADVESKVFISEASASLKSKVDAGDYASVAGTFSNIVEPAKLQAQISELRSRIDDELSSYEFLLLDHAQRLALEDHDQFGTDVKRAFPDTTWDIREAKHCYAFERYTACGYHLQCVLQLGVEEFARRFNVIYAHKDWSTILRDIKTAVTAMENDPAWKCLPNWRDHREFYNRALGYLDVEKTGWRNPLAHSRTRLESEDARLMMDNVRAFMQQMSMPPPPNQQSKSGLIQP